MAYIKELANSMVISNLIFMAQDASNSSERNRYLDYAVNQIKKKQRKLERKNYKHIIFDLDGTLIDTEQAVLKTWQFTLKEYGRECSLEELRPVLGVTTGNALKRLSLVADNQFEKRWVENYGRFAEEADFFPGVRELIEKLKAGGKSLGIVTSRSRDEYNRYFHTFHLERIFDWIVCADDTEKHKPEPEPLYKYAELAQTKISSCIYIGDMETDMECAGQAGAASGLAIWNNSHNLCKEADFVFSSPEDAIEILLFMV